MILEMNIFNICKQPGDDNDLQEVDFIEELVYDQLESTLSKIEFDESEDLLCWNTFGTCAMTQMAQYGLLGSDPICCEVGISGQSRRHRIALGFGERF